MIAKIKQIILRVKNNRKDIVIGKGSILGRRTHFEGHNSIGRNTNIRNSFVGYGSYVGDNSSLECTKIGRYSCISHCVTVVRGRHPTKEFVSIHPAFYSLHNQVKLKYVQTQRFDDYSYIDIDNRISCLIGNDVWIGYDVLILEGVTIGDGAIIAAGSIVNKNIPPYEIWGGSPAKMIRKRFSDEEIDFLTNLQWWGKNEEWIKKYADSFVNVDTLKKRLVEENETAI